MTSGCAMMDDKRFCCAEENTPLQPPPPKSESVTNRRHRHLTAMAGKISTSLIPSPSTCRTDMT